MRYPVVLHTDDGIRYGVTAPDLPGCFSAGDTLDEALESAHEAIDLHLEGIAEDGEDLPAAGMVAAHQADPNLAGGTWALVEVDTWLIRPDSTAEPRRSISPSRGAC